MIVVVDYGMGNLKSVVNACKLLGKTAKVSDSPKVLEKATKIIFPGVGHFGRAVKELKKRKLFSLLQEKAKAGVPFLGICLGMQILFEESSEAPGIKGLALFKGKVKRFSSKSLAVPHMGWNQIKKQRSKETEKQDNLFKGIKDKSFFYFVHSYYCQPKDKSIIATTTDYGVEFASSINKENVWAVQFHLEKSQSQGLRLLDNFLKL
ncbi:MAG: imidazole glycerol phosphate synthase subunit HisH [Candidatus Omnitrophica bacterium]|nr:imidazole glycerol phosphate synthase subunit HisH [Candidatus Omnitrophota bacterium]MBU2044720.1 imidazole glycerol phosphate synthase subunit HisH [Candidatus Omnitrophota bacterium]MBU2250740.1 imidazole glycerol phosphate synthase subunit HisH [Candidatus Omnitrophota bacterium]MBU2473489.1 imidazole glycerol phosphate synthase subunit HisH [Candidatus Omnitrophota bacterium]